jgi:hypothetical protein
MIGDGASDRTLARRGGAVDGDDHGFNVLSLISAEAGVAVALAAAPSR